MYLGFEDIINNLQRYIHWIKFCLLETKWLYAPNCKKKALQLLLSFKGLPSCCPGVKELFEALTWGFEITFVK